MEVKSNLILAPKRSNWWYLNGSKIVMKALATKYIFLGWNMVVWNDVMMCERWIIKTKPCGCPMQHQLVANQSSPLDRKLIYIYPVSICILRWTLICFLFLRSVTATVDVSRFPTRSQSRNVPSFPNSLVLENSESSVIRSPRVFAGKNVMWRNSSWLK